MLLPESESASNSVSANDSNCVFNFDNERVASTCNTHNNKHTTNIWNNRFIFEKGNIYEYISIILTIILKI